MRPLSVPARRSLAAMVLVALAASGCGGATASTDSVAKVSAPIHTIATTTTASVPIAEPSSFSGGVAAPGVVVGPADPHETFVADIVEEVRVLQAFVEPRGEPASLEFPITNPTYWGNPLSLMITDRSADGRWLKVQIPVRPNGTEAWIRIEDATISSHRFRARVDLTERTVTVWDGPEVVVESTAVIGKASSPTPVGRFFVNDLVEKWEGSAYGPHILTLSGFSEALETFGGGIPVIAIHGTNRPELMGGAHSNGCIRIPNEMIELLAATVPIGTPVDIVA